MPTHRVLPWFSTVKKEGEEVAVVGFWQRVAAAMGFLFNCFRIKDPHSHLSSTPVWSEFTFPLITWVEIIVGFYDFRSFVWIWSDRGNAIYLQERKISRNKNTMSSLFSSDGNFYQYLICLSVFSILLLRGNWWRSNRLEASFLYCYRTNCLFFSAFFN